MANATGGYGLRPVRHMDGSPWNGITVRCFVSANYATALFVGDPVLLDTTLANKDTTGYHPTVIASAGTAGTLIRGVITSVEPNPDNLSLLYSPASTEGYVTVCMDPCVLFAVRGEGATTPTKVIPGQNAVLIATAAGSTSTGLSGFEMDLGATTAPNTTQNFTLHVVSVLEREDNDLADNAEFLVLLNTIENATGRYLGVTAA